MTGWPAWQLMPDPTVLRLVLDVCFVLVVTGFVMVAGGLVGSLGSVELAIVQVLSVVALAVVVVRWVLARKRS